MPRIKKIGAIKPMLAKLYDKPVFNDKERIFETKFDGYRAIAEIKNGSVLLYSRNGLSFTDTYPTIVKELQKITKNVVLDGEIVAVDAKEISHFQLLQQYLQHGNIPLRYYVFDCLYKDGRSIENKPLIERKRILESILPKSDIVVYSEHIFEKGKDFFKQIQKKGLEGMMAKKTDSLYKENYRTSQWLKIKNMLTEEAIIIGYTEPRGSRQYFGSLLLATYQDGHLTYIGHTGTGFDRTTLKELYKIMQPRKVKKSPFTQKIISATPVTWLQAHLVCNLKYTEITKDGQRRHPVFMGLRIDKKAQDVHPDYPLKTNQ